MVEGELDASPAGRLELLLNLRVWGKPAEVRAIVEHELQLRSGLTRCNMDCFSPAAAPVPGAANSQKRIV